MDILSKDRISNQPYSQKNSSTFKHQEEFLSSIHVIISFPFLIHTSGLHPEMGTQFESCASKLQFCDLKLLFLSFFLMLFNFYFISRLMCLLNNHIQLILSLLEIAYVAFYKYMWKILNVSILSLKGRDAII